MTDMEIIDLPKGKFKSPSEGIELEYKESLFDLPKNIWETVSAFANTDGGVIILGVSEDKANQTYEVTGVTNAETILTNLWNINANHKKISRPVIRPENVKTFEKNGKTLIQIFVPRSASSERPIFINNHPEECFVRTDDGDRKATDEQFKYFIVDSHPNIDSQLLNNFDLSDLNLSDVHSYRAEMNQKLGVNPESEQSDFEFLKSLGVLKRDRSNSTREYKLTAGGLLFFGKYNSIIERFPNFQLDYFRYATNGSNDWDDRVSTGDLNFPEMNVYSFFKIVNDKLPISIMDKFTQDEKQTRSSYASDLRLAMKEALVNSLMHPYYDGKSPIRIIDRPSYTEFVNPGTMRVTTQEFISGADSQTRNNVIALLFRKVGIAERAGSGGPRIFLSATKNHLHAPSILGDESSTRIRIWKIDILSSISEKIQLTENERQVVRHSTSFPAGAFKMPELKEKMKRLKLSDYAIRQAVESLIEKQIIVAMGKSRSRMYYLKQTREQGMAEYMIMIKHMEDVQLGYRNKK